MLIDPYRFGPGAPEPPPPPITFFGIDTTTPYRAVDLFNITSDNAVAPWGALDAFDITTSNTIAPWPVNTFHIITAE